MVQEVTTLINNVGFPIAVSIALFYQNMKINESFNELQKAVYSNTAVTNELKNSINQSNFANKKEV